MSNKTDLQALNANYEALIEELRGKAVGGGTNLKTCTLGVFSDNTDYYPTDIAYTTVNDSGDVQYAYNSVSGSSITVTCLRNSIVAVKFKANINTTSSSAFASHLLFQNGTLAIIKIGDVEMITIKNNKEHSGGDLD